MLNESSIQFNNLKRKYSALMISSSKLSKIILTNSMHSTIRIKTNYKLLSTTHINDMSIDLNLNRYRSISFTPCVQSTISTHSSR